MRGVSDAGQDMSTWIIAGTLAVVYAVFAHYASAMTDVGAWAILLAGAPMLLAVIGVARDNRWGPLIVALAMAALGVLAWLWPTLHNPAGWLYFFQHFGINGALALIFGRTLAGGRQPLVTVFASVVHEEMTPALIRYTRQVTVAWTVFFLACAGLSAGLFFFAPIEAWSVFANILTLPLVGLMFLVENEVRKRILPKRDHLGLKATVRAFRATFRS
jgi:uncharacterized membrane protein